MRRRLERFIDEDSGVALFTVMGVILIMTLAATSAYVLAQQATLETVNVKATQAAFQAANAGVDVALARIQGNDGYRPGDFPLSGVATETGASWETSVTQPASYFLCTSVGTDRDGRKQTIKVKFFYFNLWNMNIATGSGVSNPSGGSVVGNTSIFGPLYCKGTVQLSGDANIDVGPLMVNQGSIFLNSNGCNVGSPTYGAIDVYVTGASPVIGSRGYYTSSVSNAVPNIVLPLVDQSELRQRWTDAKNQSSDNFNGDGYVTDPVNQECTTPHDGSTYATVNPPNNGVRWYNNNVVTARRRAPGADTGYYKVIGSGSTPPIPGAPTTSLTLDGSTESFGSWPGNPQHTTVNGDDFAYDSTTGKLYVYGTVYVDGPITFNRDILYVGNGALVANGNIVMNGDFLPDVPSSQTTSSGVIPAYNMNATHVVGLVTPYNITASVTGGTNKSNPYTDEPDICGAFFTGGTFTISGHPLVKGSILSNTINFADPNPMLVTDPRLPTFLPKGMPAADMSILYKGTWARK